MCECFFFFNDTATTEIYTLSLHDALPISLAIGIGALGTGVGFGGACLTIVLLLVRSEEHTSELQSRLHLVCRLLLEKKKLSRLPREGSHDRQFVSRDPDGGLLKALPQQIL